jgi:hypothetical protein
MPYKLKLKYTRARFNYCTRGILKTPPIEIKDAPWTIISMVSNSDVQMYLLSLKSLYARLGAGKITAIVDRDMPAGLRDTLESHIHGIRLIDLESIDSGPCQRGGTWERLLFLLDHSENEYAIQVDCDTLAFGSDVDEVRHCAENNIPFTLGNRKPRAMAVQSIVPMEAIAPQSQAEQSDYIGIVAERLFDRYPNAENLKYVQGSSGFAGFAKGGFTRERIEEFDRNMRRQLGDRWLEWGTEQSASNFAIANSPGAIVLPWPKYANFGPVWKKVGLDNYAFLHFVGTYRFMASMFQTLGQQIIDELLHDAYERKNTAPQRDAHEGAERAYALK